MKKTQAFGYRSVWSVVIASLLFIFLAMPAALAADKRVYDIRVEGNQRIETATIKSYVNVHPGDPFDANLMDRALKSLYATGLFADVSLYQEGNSLIVVIAENPIINEIAFEGNKSLKDEVLRGEVQLRPRTVLTRTKVQTDVERLQEVYRFSGRFSVTIEPKIIKLDQNRVNLVFEVTEGAVTHISRISFIGNKRFDDGKLQRVVRSRENRWWRFWSSDDKYDPDRMAYDREVLRKFYLDRGYADFRVESAVAELSPDRRDFLITFTVSEGNRYRVGNVHLESHMADLDPAPFKKYLTFKPEQWYRAGAVEDTVVKLTDELGNHQYAFVNVVPSVKRNKEERTVDISFNIKEGQKTFVESINIHGNVRTLDEVVRREMKLVEGDPYNKAKLKRSEQRIKNLGFFENVSVKPSAGSAPDKTNIDIKVAEKSTGELSIGAGYSTSDGVLGDFSIRERNFLGKGQTLSLASTLSGKRSEFDFSFTEPYFLKRNLGAGVDAFHTTRDLQDESSFNSRRTGGGLRLSYPLAHRLRQRLNYRFVETEITDVAVTASAFIQQQEGVRITSSLSQTLTYDTRDTRQDPSEGRLVTLINEFAGLGGDAEFFMSKLTGTQFYPVRERWILKQKLEAGHVFSWGEDDIRINERFYIGGASLRGFADAGIGPRDTATDDSLGGNTFVRGSTQLDFPSGLPVDMGVRLHLFADYGTLWGIDDTGAGIADEASPRVGVGFGVSWVSPMGPITLDFANAVVKEDFDETEGFRFNFGTRF